MLINGTSDKDVIFLKAIIATGTGIWTILRSSRISRTCNTGLRFPLFVLLVLQFLCLTGYFLEYLHLFPHGCTAHAASSSISYYLLVVSNFSYQISELERCLSYHAQPRILLSSYFITINNIIIVRVIFCWISRVIGKSILFDSIKSYHE